MYVGNSKGKYKDRSITKKMRSRIGVRDDNNNSSFDKLRMNDFLTVITVPT